MKLLIAVGIAAVAGTSTPALAGSSSARSSDSARTAGPAEAGPLTPETGLLGLPARLREPGLVRAHQIAGALVSRRRPALATDVRVCIVPTGAVTDVALKKSSGAPAFDKAVVDSAHAWVYASYPAPPGIRICALVSVVYRAR